MDLKFYLSRWFCQSIYGIFFILGLLSFQNGFASAGSDKANELNVLLKYMAPLDHCSSSLPGIETAWNLRQLALPVINGVTFTSPTDCGLDDGMITIDATGTDPMEYSINFGTSWFPNNVFTDLPAGDYIVFVRNIGETADVAYMNNPVMLVAPQAPIITNVFGSFPSNCSSTDGSITIASSPGNGMTEFSIDGGNNWQTTNVFNNIGNGYYNVYARNATGGTCAIAYNLNPVSIFSTDTPTFVSVNTVAASGCGTTDGQIIVVGSGSGALEYSIDGAASWRTVNTFSDVSAGEHNVHIRYTDGSCETAYIDNPVTVGGPINPEIVEVIAENISDCGAADGSINIVANPGVGSVEYSIDGGFLYLPDSSFTNLGPGDYAIRVRYTNGSCEVLYRDNPVQFDDPAAPAIVAIDSLDPTGCTNTDGRISISAIGDRELNYSIDGGANFQTGNVFNDLSSGTYNVVVAYVGQACTASFDNITLDNDNTGQVNISTTAVQACLNGSGDYDLSAMNISVNGGAFTSAYEVTYSSADGTFADATDVNTIFSVNDNVVGSSTINVVVTDPTSGCSANSTLAFEIVESPVTNMTPATVCAGEATSLSSGTVGLHEWSVLSGDFNSLACTSCPAPVVAPMITTVYQVSVTNVLMNACEAVDSVQITVAAGPEVLNHRDSLGLCVGDTLAVSLELNEAITNYNISSFSTYLNDVVNGTTLSFDVVLIGTSSAFTVDFTGASGCTASDNFIVQRVSSPTASFNFDTPVCGGTDILLTYTGTSSSSAVLTWDLDGGTLVYANPQMGSNPAANEITASWAAPGTYEVKFAVDDGGCMDFDTMDVVITDIAPQLSYTKTPASSCGTSFGSIDLTATGVTNVFLWEGVNGFSAITEDIGGLETGMYSVTVTDVVTMCTSVEMIMVEEDGLFNCTDYVRILVPAANPYSVCLDDVVNLPAPIVSANVCDDDPATVEVSVNQTDDCIILDPNDLFIGEDTVCVVHCDGNVPQNCDTTYVVVMVSPPTDTIMVNILANIQSEVCIPAGVLQIGGTITSSAFCGTGNSATVEGIALDDECVTLRAANGFVGLSPDYICVVNCYDNFALFCDTTYIEVTVEVNNCVDYIVEENLTIPLADCTLPSDVCIGIPFSTIGNYEVNDNGDTYTGGFVQCGTDSTSFSLAQGFHVLSFIDQATGCPDTVRIDIDNGLAFYTGETNFEVACDSILSFCLEVPYADRADYTITDNGALMTTGGCGLDSIYLYDYAGIPGQGAVGPYLLQNWTVNGSVFIGSFNTIGELVDSMNVWDPAGNWTDDAANFTIRGGDFGNTYSSTIDVSQVLGGSGTIDLSIEYNPSAVMIQLDVDAHEVVITHVPTSCSETLTFNIDCDMGSNCPDIIEDLVNLNTATCDGMASFCTGISAADFSDYNIYDNGAAYMGNLLGCDNTEYIDYSFTAVPNQGNTGPYDLVSWSVGTAIYSGISFMDLSELLAQMQIWDPTGDWTLNGSVISGGANGAPYGAIRVEYAGETYPVYPVTQVISASAALEFDTGYHQLILEYIPEGCLDTVDIYVNCLDCGDFITVENETIPLTDCNTNAIFCVEIPFIDISSYTIMDSGFPYINGTPACAGTGGLSTQLSLTVGVHELIFTHNSTGCADTVSVVVSCIMSSTQYLEMDVNTSDILCAEDTELLGNIVSVTNVCESASGEHAIFTAITDTYCYEVDAVEAGLDSACIVLCDDQGYCDTTYFVINVVDEINPEDLPLASSDVAQTVEGELVSYDVLANDLINGTLDTFYILNQPDNGFAWYDSTGTIHFQPDADFCDFANPEMISYAICNEVACDTSELLITVICDEIKTFSGFSPNGDGINDNFMIQGAELYPNSQLFVFSRWGTLIFKVTGYGNDWDGTWQGAPLPEGTYFYMYDTGEGETKTGYVQIHR